MNTSLSCISDQISGCADYSAVLLAAFRSTAGVTGLVLVEGSYPFERFGFPCHIFLKTIK